MIAGEGGLIIGDVRGDRVPPREGEATHQVMVRIEDVDAHCAHARAAGARILSEPQTYPYGERQYTAQDFAGHQWTFSETMQDMAPEDWGGETISPS
jgi:uncharacterized glyoxalase superfamily protein PhnB